MFDIKNIKEREREREREREIIYILFIYFIGGGGGRAGGCTISRQTKKKNAADAS